MRRPGTRICCSAGRGTPFLDLHRNSNKSHALSLSSRMSRVHQYGDRTGHRYRLADNVRGRTNSERLKHSSTRLERETTWSSQHRQQQAGRVAKRMDRREQSTTGSSASERSTEQRRAQKGNDKPQNGTELNEGRGQLPHSMQRGAVRWVRWTAIPDRRAQRISAT